MRITREKGSWLPSLFSAELYAIVNYYIFVYAAWMLVDEQKLKYELEQYKQMTDATPVCIKIFDATGKLLFINEGGRKEHFLRDTDDISSWDWIKTVKEEYRDKVLAAFKNGLAGESSRIEMKHTPEGSTHQWCEGFISPIMDDDGKITRVLFYSTDITDKKEAELETGSSLEHINDLVVGREVKMVELKEKIKQLERELLRSTTSPVN